MQIFTGEDGRKFVSPWEFGLRLKLPVELFGNTDFIKLGDLAIELEKEEDINYPETYLNTLEAVEEMIRETYLVTLRPVGEENESCN